MHCSRGVNGHWHTHCKLRNMGVASDRGLHREPEEPRVHVLGSVVLLGVGIVSLAAPAYLALVVMTASLATLAVFDRR